MLKSPKIILRYVIGLVAVFGVGFVLLVGLHFSFTKILASFDRELDNERARIAIGQEIIANINQVERNFYQLATTSTGSRSVEKIYARSEQFFANIERAFMVFKDGGSLTVSTRLNQQGLQDFRRTITYVPKANEGYVLEVIDLRPKVLEVRERMQTLTYLISKRNSLIRSGDKATLEAVRDEILIFLKKSPSHFVRLHENAHALHYQGHKNLERLKGEISRRKAYYAKIAVGLMVAIISGVFIICWLVARQIYIVHSQLGFISQEMEKAKKEAEVANKIKTDFLATMSHEVRTPLNIIMGMTGLALETELAPSQQRYLRRIQDAGEILLGLLNDILDFSKIDEGKMEFVDQPFNLNELIYAVAEVAKMEARPKGISVEVSVADSSWVPTGDPVRMRQILRILASNAVKFTEKGKVVIEARLEELAPHRLLAVVSVRDTGIGIPKEQLATIFDTFAQGDTSATRKYGGTGLGLAICNQLVKLMGGEIAVESEVGKGSIFTLSLPMNTSTSPEGQLSGSQSALATGPVRALDILLADGDSDQQALAQAILEKAGHRVKKADDGLAALRSMAKFSYDLVVLALAMPGLAGREVARDIRAFERGESVTRPELGYDIDWLAARLNGQHTFLVAIADELHENGQVPDQEDTLFDGHVGRGYGQDEIVGIVNRLVSAG